MERLFRVTGCTTSMDRSCLRQVILPLACILVGACSGSGASAPTGPSKALDTQVGSTKSGERRDSVPPSPPPTPAARPDSAPSPATPVTGTPRPAAPQELVPMRGTFVLRSVGDSTVPFLSQSSPTGQNFFAADTLRFDGTGRAAEVTYFRIDPSGGGASTYSVVRTPYFVVRSKTEGAVLLVWTVCAWSNCARDIYEPSPAERLPTGQLRVRFGGGPSTYRYALFDEIKE